jgi:hypothetical protein
VIDLDNNGEILMACRESCSLEGLISDGVEATASQLQLLQVMNLIMQEASGRWTTSFPILDSEATGELRDEARGMAQKAVAAVRPEIDSLNQALEAGGLQRHAYTVYFSYLLDGMAWGFLEEYRRVPVRRLSAARPFWAGELWALESAPTDWLGTATIADRGLTLRVLMSRPLEARLKPLLGARPWIKKALKDYLVDGRVGEGEAQELLEIFGIVDEHGSVKIPVIDEIGGDDVFRAVEKLTSRLVDWLLAEVDLEALRASYGLRSEPQTLVIVYHELMWSLMSELEQEGFVERPEVLNNPEAMTNQDLGQLVLLVDRARRASVDDTDAAAVETREETREEEKER